MTDFCEINRTLIEASEAGDNIEYTALNNITSGHVIEANANISFNSGNEIDLIPGFEVEANAMFHAYILGCPF